MHYFKKSTDGLLFACRLLAFFELGLLLFLETLEFFTLGHGSPGIVFGALLVKHPLLLLIQGSLLVNPKGEINFPQDHANVRKFVVHYTVSPPTHWFDAFQHERPRGKALRDLELRNLEPVPNVREVAGALEHFGHQVCIFLVAEFQLRQGFLQRETRRQLADSVQFPRRVANGLLAPDVGSAVVQASPDDAWFQFGELSRVQNHSVLLAGLAVGKHGGCGGGQHSVRLLLLLFVFLCIVASPVAVGSVVVVVVVVVGLCGGIRRKLPCDSQR